MGCDQEALKPQMYHKYGLSRRMEFYTPLITDASQRSNVREYRFLTVWRHLESMHKQFGRGSSPLKMMEPQ